MNNKKYPDVKYPHVYLIFLFIELMPKQVQLLKNINFHVTHNDSNFVLHVFDEKY